MNLQPEEYFRRLSSALLYHEEGKITKSMGLTFEAILPGAAIGSLCDILPNPLTDPFTKYEAEVVGFNEKRVVLMPFEEVHGINNESRVIVRKKTSSVRVGAQMLGRVINSRARPIDGKDDFSWSGEDSQERSLYHKPEAPMGRRMISESLDLGVRAINGLLTCGKGQRLGIMAGSGVGKSVLLGMMARNTSAEVNVIALIGERGREVKEFIERDLGEEGLRRSVVIVATSDESPILRMRGAFLAATIAEHFREMGKSVLLLMDSVTRFSMAQRQIGLSLGEPPTSKGYTPSVFATLPKLLERAGTHSGPGSITGIYTVLVEGDDFDEPVTDAARSILDGHIILTRQLARQNHFPAIDVLQSTSRVVPLVTTAEHRKMAGQIKEWIALYQQVEDLINLGAYVKGANWRIDQAVEVHERILNFLRQGMEDRVSYQSTLEQMRSIVLAGEAFAASIQSR